MSLSRGNLFKTSGFSLAFENSWHQFAADTPDLNPQKNATLAKFLMDQGQLVTVKKIDQGVAGRSNLELVAKALTKDFRMMGFEILKVERVNPKDQRVLIMDLHARSLDQTVRQYYWMKEDQLIQLTCGAKVPYANSLIDACNRIAKTFFWL